MTVINQTPVAQSDEDIGEVVLSNTDIEDAMEHIPGYLDISSEDFRVLYHLAHHNAMDRLIGGINVQNLLRGGCLPLTVDMMIDQAARAIVDGGFKGAPVVDAAGMVIGMLTETDYLRRMKAKNFLDLLLQMLDDSGEISHRCHETRVGEVMTSPAVAIAVNASFREIQAAFREHPGRSMPVVDKYGHFLGMLLRKDFLSALDWGPHEN
jgi:CBS domain-containing membrane protein